MKQAPVYFENAFAQLNEFIVKHSDRKIIFLVDENTHEYCLPILLAELPEIQDMEIIEIPSGEDSKSIEIATQVWISLSELGADRNSIIINCGGGVVTDFGGFLASTFKRGVKFINVPTSLLSMVDASVGAKTGINLNHLKNQIGTFAQPEMVVINPDFLLTLPEKEMLSGFAEMLKHGLIQDVNHWNQLKEISTLSPENLAPLIQASVEIKKAVVEQDPTEKGLRKILNAGHTIGHALETHFLDHKIQITHGEAVALGLVLESYIAVMKKRLSLNDFEEIKSVIDKFYTKVDLPKAEQILPLLMHDKKNVGNEIQCVLLDKIGLCNPEPVNISIAEVDLAFDFYQNN